MSASTDGPAPDRGVTDPGAFWDAKFAPARYAYGEAPNVFLAAQAAAFPPRGAVLALGEGEGRNAVSLAERGFAVTAVDASPRGLAKLADLAARRGVAVPATLADLATHDLGEARWDGVYNVYCHLWPETREALYPRIRRALKPGGVFVTEQFATDQLGLASGGPKDVRLLLTLAELEAAFAGYQVLYAAHEPTTLDEGPLHQGPASVVRLVARKPL